MDRQALAEECAEIEKAGSSVREYLKERGCVSPWGTWFRLQREQLGRRNNEITDGKGDKNMAGRKVTLEQKKKAVEIAIGGGNPLPFLKQCGSDAPDKLWYTIKQNVKKADPEKFAQIPERIRPVNMELSMAPVPKPVTDLTIESEELTKMEIEQEKLKEEARRTVEGIISRSDMADADKVLNRPVNYDGFEVMALKSPATGFRFEYDGRYGMVTWRTIEGDEVTKTAEEWHMMAAELTKVLQIFGI